MSNNEFRMVPVEPTQAMCIAGQEKAREWPRFPLRIGPIYRAMLAAAPQPAAAPQAEPECDRCGEPVSRHTSSHWCDNQSFEMPRGLHAAPQPAGEALTDERIFDCFATSSGAGKGEYMLAVGRAIEREVRADAAARIAALEAERDASHAELLQIHAAIMCIAEAPEGTEEHQYTVREVLRALSRLRKVQAERDETRAEVARLREALQRIVDWDDAGMALTEDHITQARQAIGAAPSKPGAPA